MRISVDRARCQGHTQCSFVAPDLFLLRDADGHAEAAVEVVPPEREHAALLARDGCPEQAIIVHDE